MKRLIYILSAIFMALYQNINAQDVATEMSDEDRLNLAVTMHDAGDYEASVKEYEYLVKKHPDNSVYRYELAYTLSELKQYKEAVKECEILSKLDDCNWQVYQMWGSCLDYDGDPNGAIEIYKKGIERYPEAEYLYMEIGTTYLRYGHYDESIKWYNQAIFVNPGFQSPYYRGASAYNQTEDKVWALIYAETSIMLNMSNTGRFDEMSNLIRDVFSQNITASGDSLKIKLCPNRGITVLSDEKTEDGQSMALLDFSGVYEACVFSSLIPDYITMKDSVAVFTLESLTNMRRQALETYYKVTDNLFGNSMYLLEYHKKVLDAGHWDAYNAFLLQFAFPDEAESWYENHEKEIEAFADWYGDNMFELDAEHTVGALSISRDERRIPLIETFMMLSRLSTGGLDVDADDTDEAEE